MNGSQPKGIIIATGIFPPDIGGPASYARTVAVRLHEKGVPVCVVSYSKKFDTKESDHRFPFPVVRVWGGWPIWIKHAIFGIKLLFLVPKYEKVFALNIWNAGFPARIAARIYRKKFLVRIVGDYAWEVAVGKGRTSLLLDDFQKSKKSGWIGWLSALQSKICKGANMIIVPSEYLAGIVHGWGVPQDKIKIVYNGTEFAVSPLTKEEAKKKLGLTGNVLLSAGRLVPWKGFRLLVKIMPQLASVNHFFQLVIVGEGPDRKILETMVKNMGLERKVKLVGRKSQTELADYLAATDLFVLNTGYEGFSHQIIEVMRAGVPLVTTNAGGNKEVIHQGENGMMVKYNDEFNLIEVIRAVWNNPEMREHFIEEGKKTAAYFSVEKMFDETVSLINSL